MYRCRCQDNETISDEVQIVVSGYPVTLKETGDFISPFTKKPYLSIAKYMKQEMRITQELPMEFYCYVFRGFVGFLVETTNIQFQPSGHIAKDGIRQNVICATWRCHSQDRTSSYNLIQEDKYLIITRPELQPLTLTKTRIHHLLPLTHHDNGNAQILFHTDTLAGDVKNVFSNLFKEDPLISIPLEKNFDEKLCKDRNWCIQIHSKPTTRTPKHPKTSFEPGTYRCPSFTIKPKKGRVVFSGPVNQVWPPNK